MQTHEDMQHQNEFFARLKQRAAEMERGKQSEITAGKEGEEELAVWSSNGVQCRHLPPDEQGILRISIGGGQTPIPLNYCVVRGDLGQVIDLLKQAITALKKAP